MARNMISAPLLAPPCLIRTGPPTLKASQALQPPGPAAVNSVGAGFLALHERARPGSRQGRSIASPQTCRDMAKPARESYLGQVGNAYLNKGAILSGPEARFYRPDLVTRPGVALYFAAQKPVNLPVTFSGGEIKFTDTSVAPMRCCLHARCCLLAIID